MRHALRRRPPLAAPSPTARQHPRGHTSASAPVRASHRRGARAPAGFRAKLVSSLHPPPRLAPKGKAAQAAGVKGGKAAAEGRRAAHDHELHVPLWCEAFLPGAAQWAALDALAAARLLCAHPADAMRARCPPKASPLYIVGFGDGGAATDVTARYVDDYGGCCVARTDASWWEAALAAHRAAAVGSAAGHADGGAEGGRGMRGQDGSGGTASTPIDLDDEDEGGESSTAPRGVGAAQAGDTTHAAHAAHAAAEAEAAELRARAEALPPLPTSLNLYKKHPQFVLERDIGRYEAVHPPSTASVGLCKGQRVFARSAVHRLLAAERWFREGRELKPDEEPAKRLKKAASAATSAAASAAAAEGEMSPADADRASEASEVRLYGRWQTIAYVPPTAQGGVVPRSSHGHVEMWTDAHLPYGTARLREPHVMQVARQLGIDCAPAMVGFDIRDGRPVPRFDGVVVCEEFAALLVEAAAARQEQTDDREAHQRRAQVLDLWRRTLLALGVRCRLQEEYGGEGQHIGGSGSGGGAGGNDEPL